MKVLKIEGENLASLKRRFLIDFTAEPLASAPIFAISGATGSGKSTILDALSISLYNRTPRTSSAGRGKIDDGGEGELHPNDPRTLLRRGAGEGWAATTFIGVDGERYRSEWRVRRAHGRVDGNLQGYNISLTNESRGVEIGGRNSELLSKIVELTGLTFDQFTRSCLLAQGEFATFLKSGENEKAELLEKLTGTEIYSQISISIYQKWKEAEAGVDEIRRELKHYQLLSEEECQEMSVKLKERRKEHEKSLGEKRELENLKRWLEEEKKLDVEVTEGDKELERANISFSEAADRFKYLEQYEKLQSFHPLWALYNRELTSIKKGEKERVEAREEKEKEKENEELLEGKLKESRDALEEINKKIKEREKEVDEAIRVDSDITKLQEEIKKLEEEKGKKKEELKESENKFNELNEKNEALNKEVKECEFNLEKFSPLKSAIADQAHLITTIRGCSSNGTSIAQMTKKIEEDKEKLEKIEGEEKREREKLKKMESVLSTQFLELRASLEEGSPCPLCGSTHHPFVTQLEELESDDKREGGEIDLEKLNNKREKVEKLKTDIDKKRTKLSTKESLLEQIKTSYQEQKEVLKSYLEGSYPNWKEHLKDGTLESKMNNLFIKWGKWKEQKEKNEKEINQLTPPLTEAKTLFKQTQKEFKQQQKVLEEREGTLKEKKKSRKELLDGLSVENYRERVRKNREEREKEVKEREAKVTQSKNNLATLQASIKEKEKEIKESEEERDKHLLKLHSMIAQGEEWITLERVKESATLEESFIREEKSALEEIKKEVERCQTNLEERKRRVKEHLSQRVEVEWWQRELEVENNLKELERVTETIKERESSAKALQGEIIKIEQEFEREQKKREKSEKLNENLKEKTTLSNQWERLNITFGSASGDKFKKIAQSYTLDILLHSTNSHLKDLTPRYTVERSGPTSLILQVRDNDMVGEVRSVHSLSGGESFLLSLALALGLSSLSSRAISIESLFIDEGFGSLDGESLRDAVAALEKLQSSGRKVGVISHIDEMTEKIGVEVKIVKEGGGASRVEVVSAR